MELGLKGLRQISLRQGGNLDNSFEIKNICLFILPVKHKSLAFGTLISFRN